MFLIPLFECYVTFGLSSVAKGRGFTRATVCQRVLAVFVSARYSV